MNQSASTFGFLAAFSLLIIFGCQRDKCRTVNCGDGTCVEGNCICPAGFEGVGCSTLVGEKFIGSFDNKEACRAGSDAYTVKILQSPAAATSLQVIGLWESTDTLTAVVVPEGDQFGFPRQAIGQNEIQGSGHVDEASGDILLEYFVYSPGLVNAFDGCNATLSRQ